MACPDVKEMNGPHNYITYIYRLQQKAQIAIH